MERSIENARNAGAVPEGRGRIIKKIPAELRVSTNRLRPRTLRDRLRYDSQLLRNLVQAFFVVLVLWIGIEFHYFVVWGGSNGRSPYVQRPPGVEGFLPISSLISLKYWWETGIVNTIHPSGVMIFLAILVIGLILKKSFCSWLCPIGTLSEGLWEAGRKIFGRTLRLPRILDYPLRGVKYLLLAFFLYAVLAMTPEDIRQFVFSPYNKVADIKMYYFFAEISTFALVIIGILVLLSVVVKNFWCRYLCPYGALLGLASFLSPLKITRKADSCIDCALCTKACPSAINVHTARRVWSDECTSCMRCVQVCPVKETLEMRTALTRRKIPAAVLGALAVGIFVAVTGLAMLTGHWHNSITKEEYLRRMQELDKPQYNHFRGHVPSYGPND